MEIQSIIRENTGRGKSRQLRRDGFIPAIIYGDGQSYPIACESRKIKVQMRDEAFRSSVLTIVAGDKKFSALLREIQMHPFRQEILHMDFQAVRDDVEISTNIPIHFINVENATGVKLQHGIFTSIENELSVHCLPKDLPEFITIDVGTLEIGRSIHLVDVVPPKGVRFDAIVRGENPALAIISEPETEKESGESGEQDNTSSSATS